MVEKHRSKRGSLSSRIKSAMFSVYGIDQLPYINTNASGRKILEWKNSNQVKRCYEKLHTYMDKIVEKVCEREQARSLPQVAFTKASVKMMLNPKIDKIKSNETFMRKKIEKYMVCQLYIIFF